MRCRRQAPTGGTANPTLVGGTDDEAAQTPSGVGQEFLSVIWVGIWRIGRDEEASSERDKQLRAELAEGLGYFAASLAAGERRPVESGNAAEHCVTEVDIFQVRGVEVEIVCGPAIFVIAQVIGDGRGYSSMARTNASVRNTIATAKGASFAFMNMFP